jgi:hypothetical protein
MKLPKDKLLHLIAGTCIGALTALLVCPTMFAGFTAALILGIAKEVYDERHDGAADPADVLATVVGGIAGAALTIWLGGVLL